LGVLGVTPCFFQNSQENQMYKLLVVRYDSSLGSYDDAEFTKFCEST